jgi:hypothetical protein
MQFITLSPMTCCSVWGILVISPLFIGLQAEVDFRMPGSAVLPRQARVTVVLFNKKKMFGKSINFLPLSKKLIQKTNLQK